MEMIFEPRQSGKTTKLLKDIAKNDIPIVTHNLEYVKLLKRMANDLNIIIPEPLTYNRILKSLPANKKQKVYLDDIEVLLSIIGSKHGYEIVKAAASSK